MGVAKPARAPLPAAAVAVEAANVPPSTGQTAEPLRETVETVERLRTAMMMASQHVEAFQRAIEARLELLGAYAKASQAEVRALEDALVGKGHDADALVERVAAVEEQAARLLSLYVATHQLHATLDPDAVKRALAEIVEGLLGAERFALLLRRDGSHACDVALAKGLLSCDPLASGAYPGGDPVIDGALSDGELRTGARAGARAVAVVPLRVQSNVVGVLVIGKLLSHKAGLTEGDSDVLELLASHAAAALFLSQVHATADRKRRTLEELVALARRS